MSGASVFCDIMPVLIEFKDVSSFTGDGRVVFDGANLSLSSGQRVALAAPPASGKGAFLKLVAGLLMPDKGVVSVFGSATATLGKGGLNEMRKRMGFIFQDALLISNLKVIENVALPLMYHSDKPYAKCLEESLRLLDVVGFTGNVWALPGPLPQYVKKEVALAKALALEPEIIVCENLSVGLDSNELTHLTGLLVDYHVAHPASLLVVTASAEEDSVAIKPDRIVRIENHRLTE